MPCASNPTGDAVQPRRPVLAEGVVRMLGEPVAIVVAEDRYAARDAADLVAVDYEPLPAVFDAEDALPRARPSCTRTPPTTCAARSCTRRRASMRLFEAAPVT